MFTCVVGEDRTHGFFVAVFERPSCAVGEAQTALPPPMRRPAACPAVPAANGDEVKRGKKKKKKKEKKKKGETVVASSSKRSLEEPETNAPDDDGVDLALSSADSGHPDGAIGSTRTQRKNRARRQQKKRKKMHATALVQSAAGPLS